MIFLRRMGDVADLQFRPAAICAHLPDGGKAGGRVVQDIVDRCFLAGPGKDVRDVQSIRKRLIKLI